MSDKSTVYVTQEPRNGINLTPAIKYGSLSTLVDRNRNVQDAGFITRDLLLKLRSFSDDDFILAVGDPVIIGLVCSIAAKHNGGRYIILNWDRQGKCYFPVKVNLNQL